MLLGQLGNALASQHIQSGDQYVTSGSGIDNVLDVTVSSSLEGGSLLVSELLFQSSSGSLSRDLISIQQSYSSLGRR